MRETRRWCTKHARILQNADFATQFSAGQFKDDDSKAWRVVLRTNYLHRDLNPDDDIAFQDVCTAFNNLGVGNPMIPSGVIALLFAHAIKWPPAVRHCHERLRALSQGGTIIADHIFDAYYGTVVWADGRKLIGMHDVLSRAGRAHAASGLAVNTMQLGVIAKKDPGVGTWRMISLGRAGTKYYLRSKEELGDCVAVVSAYLEAAEKKTAAMAEFGHSVSCFRRQCLPLNDDLPFRNPWQQCRLYRRERHTKRT